MSDAASICMIQRAGLEPPLFFYTHSGGAELPWRLQVALASDAGLDRWDDEPYLARIIFCTMMDPSEQTGETGDAITIYLTDSQYPILAVNSRSKIVGISSEANPTQPVKTWTFDQFVVLKFGLDPWADLGLVL